MGSSHSHPMFPPSPIPHSKSGPPPRPNFSGRPSSKHTQTNSNASSSSLASLLPSISSTSSPSPLDSPRPGSSNPSTRSSSPFRPFRRSNTRDAPVSAQTKPSLFSARKKERAISGERTKTSTWEIGPHSHIMNLERGKARTWGGPGREYTKTAEETAMNRVKGRWVNRVKIGEEGEAWFY